MIAWVLYTINIIRMLKKNITEIIQNKDREL